MRNEQTDNQGQPIRLFIGFHETSWEAEYRRSIVQIAIETAVRNESGLDRETILHVVPKEKVPAAKSSAPATCKTRGGHCAAIRKMIPWQSIEEQIRQT